MVKEVVYMSIINKTLNSINDFSKKMIIAGCLIVAVLCIIGACLILYNGMVTHVALLDEIGTTLIKKSTIIFAQFIIGALLIDWFKNFMDNNDDDD